MKLLFLVLAAFCFVTVNAQGGKPPASPHDTVSNSHVSITYGRPYKKGRDIFGALEPYGKVYRLGANEATTITFNSDVKFNGEKVKAGTYTLFAIPNATEWTFILNGKLGQWGAFSYDKNKDQDVAKTTVPVKKLDHVVEQLTITIDKKNTVIVEWDQTRVELPLKF
jgi:hypothetical protein